MIDIPFSDLEAILQKGEIELEGILPWSSNYTFLLTICEGEQEIRAVYKPRRGERPLWDFSPGTLCNREVAAYLVSEALGWRLIPPTIMRQGPHGPGSMQWFVPHDPELHYFTFEGEFPKQIQRLALFDVVVNNADRKSGHVLLGEHDRIWAIDHGICFHAEYKLRTVVWEYAGIKVPVELLHDIDRFLTLLEPDAPLYQQLAPLLSRKEIEAMQTRTSQLARHKRFPEPGPGRHYPWPLV
jgi:hypothetical protein